MSIGGGPENSARLLNEHIEALLAILALSPAPDADTVMVPREATINMLAAWWRQKNCGTQEIGGYDPLHMSDCDAYRAILAASQVKPDPLPVIPEGMKPWHGGEDAPADWDGGPVRCRCGLEMRAVGITDWKHLDNDADILAYTPAPFASPEPGEVQ
jgi:hypothetical protein